MLLKLKIEHHNNLHKGAKVEKSNISGFVQREQNRGKYSNQEYQQLD